jgi:hypothetical protein
VQLTPAGEVGDEVQANQRQKEHGGGGGRHEEVNAGAVAADRAEGVGQCSPRLNGHRKDEGEIKRPRYVETPDERDGGEGQRESQGGLGVPAGRG